MRNESKAEHKVDAEVKSQDKGHPLKKEPGIKSDKLSGMKIHGGEANLSKARAMCEKHNERGSHAPMVGGHKMPY